MAHQVAARLSFEPLQDIMNELARYGLSESDEPRKSLGPGIKSTVRAREKIENDYKGDCTRLKDAIRFTIYASDINDFRVCCEGAEVMERDGRIHIKLVKNRFIGKSAPGGYRDGNFVFELLETECLVEMQILIVEYARIKEHAHTSYEVCRTLNLVGDLPEGYDAASDESSSGGGYAQLCLKALLGIDAIGIIVYT